MENNIYIFYDEEVSDYVLFDELSNMYWLCINKKQTETISPLISNVYWNCHFFTFLMVF